MLGRIARDGTPAEAVRELPGLRDFAELVGLPEVEEVGARFPDG